MVQFFQDIGPVQQYSLGDNHCSAIIQGKLYTWGKGSWGRLGLGDQSDANLPVLNPYLQEPVELVSCGGYHSLILTQSKSVFSFGWAKNGRLGIGQNFHTAVVSQYPQFDSESKEEIEHKPYDGTSVFVPVKVPFDDKSIVSVYAGESYSMALTSDGKVFSWGAGVWGCLGNGDEKDCQRPTEISFFSKNGIKIKSLACGSTHVLATDGVHVYTWGRNNYGQLGRPDIPDLVCVPGIIVTSEELTDVKQVSAGKSHSAIVTNSGKLYTFGSNAEGMLGLGSALNASTPSLVTTSEKVINVACGWSHTALVTEKGSVYSFGSNANGRLGI